MSNIILNIKKSLQEYKIIFKYWLFFLAFGIVSRIVMLFVYSENIEFMDYIYTIVYGVRMDTIVFSALWIIFVFLYIFNLNIILKIILSIVTSLYILIELATFGYMQKFASRPTYLFIEHLDNYNEIFSMVFKLYPVYFVICIIFIILVFYKLYLYFTITLKNGSIKIKLIALPFVLFLLAIGGRSSFDSATPNQGFYTFSNININNEIANNSIFSILYSTYLSKKEKNYDYGKLSSKEAIENIKNMYNIDNNSSTLIRLQKSSFSKKKNIILVILEGIGHEHTGYLGGTPTTPNIDRLTNESLYFTNLYAVGSRTSWGVSSVLSSLYPIPTREYVKAVKSQKNFYTVARTLKQQNYKNIFLYSGDINFDNMKGFLLSNGYDKVLGKESFSNDLEKYTWGYCDEDLYSKAIELIEKSKNKPFFLTLLTLSSHEPFDYPKGKVDVYKTIKEEQFANSVKYSDYAIGKFIQKLKDKGLMENTVVAFISDHTKSVRGNFDVPIDKYKIASLILSSDYEAIGGRKYSKIASQIDFMPTVLDIAGIDAVIPSMGASVLKYEKNSAILLARKKNFAYMLQDKFIIFKPKGKTQTYDYKFNKLENDVKDVKMGLSYIYGAKYLYEKEIYRDIN